MCSFEDNINNFDLKYISKMRNGYGDGPHSHRSRLYPCRIKILSCQHVIYILPPFAS